MLKLATEQQLQCGHGEFAVENVYTGRLGVISNDKLQCGHGEFAVENPGNVGRNWRRGSSFNAATANSPWRTACEGYILTPGGVASMRPRRIRRGERPCGV